MDADTILAELRSRAVTANLDGMRWYGIKTDRALGVPVPKLRELAKQLGRSHSLALALWETGVHEARILASLVDEPSKVTEEQMDRWVRDFDSWDVCDSCCGNLFDRTRFSYRKATEWARDGAEFVKRAGFVLIAELAVHDKKAPNEAFVRFFPAIRRGSLDERNFVRKAVNWALRQIGKRNESLNVLAVKLAEQIGERDSRAARWVSSDALRELTGPGVQNRLRQR
jgi:3-methyladenine DNA glycosylase AlkD